MPSGGKGFAGWSNVSVVELYAKPAPREGAARNLKSTIKPVGRFQSLLRIRSHLFKTLVRAPIQVVYVSQEIVFHETTRLAVLLFFIDGLRMYASFIEYI